MVLVAGGIAASGVTASAELYNPATGSFAQTTALNTARESHGATLLNNGTVLIVGGANGATVTSAAELY
jgi:hypothetical protein